MATDTVTTGMVIMVMDTVTTGMVIMATDTVTTGMVITAMDTVTTGMVIMATDTVTTGMVIMATIITTDMAVGGTDAGTATASVLVGVGPRMATSGSVTNLQHRASASANAPLL